MSYEVKSSSCADRCEVTDFQHCYIWAMIIYTLLNHFFPIPAVHDLPSLLECCISPPTNQYFCLKASGWSCIQPSPLYLAGISQCSLLDFSCKTFATWNWNYISYETHKPLRNKLSESLRLQHKTSDFSPLTPQMIVLLQIHSFIISVFHLLFSSNCNPFYTASLLPLKVINSVTELFNQAKYWLA